MSFLYCFPTPRFSYLLSSVSTLKINIYIYIFLAIRPFLPYYRRPRVLTSGLDPFAFSSTGQVWRRSWKHMPFGDHL